MTEETCRHVALPDEQAPPPAVESDGSLLLEARIVTAA